MISVDAANGVVKVKDLQTKKAHRDQDDWRYAGTAAARADGRDDGAAHQRRSGRTWRPWWSRWTWSRAGCRSTRWCGRPSGGSTSRRLAGTRRSGWTRRWWTRQLRPAAGAGTHASDAAHRFESRRRLDHLEHQRNRSWKLDGNHTGRRSRAFPGCCTAYEFGRSELRRVELRWRYSGSVNFRKYPRRRYSLRNLHSLQLVLGAYSSAEKRAL